MIQSQRILRPRRRRRRERSNLERWLVSKRADERSLAQETLDAMGPETSAKYLQMLLDEARESTRLPFWWSFLPILLSLLPLVRAMFDWRFDIIFFLQIIGMTVFFFGLLNQERMGRRREHLRRALVPLLAERSHRHHLREYLAALDSTDETTVRQGERGLQRLFPQLTREDVYLLPLETWDALLHFLKDRRHPNLTKPMSTDLAEALIAGFCGIGYEAAIPVVEAIATGDATTASDIRLRETARRYLPRLTNTTETPWYIRKYATGSESVVARTQQGGNEERPQAWYVRNG